MSLRAYQYGELAGVALVLGSVAMQMFYLDPLKREIEWRLAAYSMQQSGQIETRTAFDNQIALLRAVNAGDAQISETEARRDKALAQFKTADANVSDYMVEKQRVEDELQWITIGLFSVGTLLTAIGRAGEMRSKARE